MRTSFHHQPEAQHPKSPAIYTPAGRLPHLFVNTRRTLTPPQVRPIQLISCGYSTWQRSQHLHLSRPLMKRRKPYWIKRFDQRGRGLILRAILQAWVRTRRPKRCKLAIKPWLRQAVASKIRLNWAPEQIAGWLKRAHPDGGFY